MVEKFLYKEGYKLMRNLTMMTDFYQLTMANGYISCNKNEEAVFDLFFRENDINSYAIAGGLEQVIDYIQNLKFTKEDIEYLRSQNCFSEDFLEYLKGFRFTGDMYAVPEGTVVFPQEPILTVKAPIMEAQIIETAMLTFINHQTLIATKGARVKYAAGDQIVMEFGLRRAQGADAGIYGTRASIIGGLDGTSNVYTAKEFDIKAMGTHSHSWVMSFPDEITAFREYAKLYPKNCLLLVDTFDTLKSGLPNAIKVFNELKEKGYRPSGIRIDSGDLAYLTKIARKMLDDAGFPDAKICASGDLDEYAIETLRMQGAKIDSWGIGTKLITSESMPSLGGVYKMSAIIKDGEVIPKIKVSDNVKKMTNPGFKTLYRLYDKATGMAIADEITLFDEVIDDSVPLKIFHPIETWKQMELTNFYAKKLPVQIFRDGKLVYEKPKLSEIKEYSAKDKATIWDEYKRVHLPHIYKVDLSQKLFDLKTSMLRKIKEL